MNMHWIVLSDQNIADDLLHILDDIRQQANEEDGYRKLILTLLNRCSSSAVFPF